MSPILIEKKNQYITKIYSLKLFKKELCTKTPPPPSFYFSPCLPSLSVKKIKIKEILISHRFSITVTR